MVVFDDMPKDDPDNPIIQDEPSAVAMVRFVAQYPGKLNCQISQMLVIDICKKIKKMIQYFTTRSALAHLTPLGNSC